MSAVISGVQYPLPDVAITRELLGMLFDGLVVKQAAAKMDATPKSTGYCGVYLSDAGAPVAVCACDLAFAANSGAALSMLPPNIAKDAIKTKQLTDVMLANLREVMNICTRLLIRDNTPHVRLDQVVPVAAVSAPIAAIIGAPRARIDFEIGLGKYGTGQIAVMAL
jgi:hypothetical protein